jgi:hypothetical protein
MLGCSYDRNGQAAYSLSLQSPPFEILSPGACMLDDAQTQRVLLMDISCKDGEDVGRRDVYMYRNMRGIWHCVLE